MSEKITAIEAPLSDEQTQQVKALLSSRKSIAEIQAELAGILGSGTSQAQRERMTSCGSCSCRTGYRTCTEYVFSNGRWVPVGVRLEQCGLGDRIIGCLQGLLGG